MNKTASITYGSFIYFLLYLPIVVLVVFLIIHPLETAETTGGYQPLIECISRVPNFFDTYFNSELFF